MTDKNALSELYRQNLERDIIAALAEMKNTDLRTAMDIYYKSRLSAQIAGGVFGIDNLDCKYLAEDLIENEPELFAGKQL